MADDRRVALVLSPHPDDELLGCPAHLFELRDAGWRILDVALSLGSDEERQTARRRELEAACARAGFELVLETGLLSMGDPGAVTPDGGAAQRVAQLAREAHAQLLVAPSPHDDHPAHERVGRLALAAMRAGASPRLWLWGVWSDIALPNSLCVFDAGRLAEIERALCAHEGELARNDYRRLLRARAEAGATLLPERVFGHGTPGLPSGAFAEAVCDLRLGPGGELILAAPATFDAAAFPAAEDAGAPADAWLDQPTARAATGARPGS
jgi:LmbE family N-acetylglucosaminyl deacetylase